MTDSLAQARTVQLLQPPRIGFGVGVAEEAVDYLANRGCRNVLLLASGSALPAAGQFVDSLRNAVETVTVRGGIPAEPDVACVEKLREEIRDLSLDAVVGLGGGSVLDVAKVVAALHGRPEPVRNFFGRDLLPKRAIHLLCLPTTAGAGSEVSPNAVLYDEEAGLKNAAISPELIPDGAFIDPGFARTLPPATTAATGFDAMCHCLEAFANRVSHPIVDRYALEGVRLIARHLPRAVNEGGDLEARSAVALGSLYGGLCLGPVNTAAVHALSYPLGSRFRLAHGLANALLMPHVVRFNIPAAPERYAEIARALGVKADGDAGQIARAGADRLFELAAECGLELSLRPYGVTEAAVDDLATDALSITRLLQNNLRSMAFEDIRTLYLNALRPS